MEKEMLIDNILKFLGILEIDEAQLGLIVSLLRQKDEESLEKMLIEMKNTCNTFEIKTKTTLHKYEKIQRNLDESKEKIIDEQNIEATLLF